MINIPYLLQFIWSGGFNLVSRILPSYFATVASASQISIIYSIYAVAKLFAMPCGWVSDKIGKTKALFLVFFILPLAAISFTFSKSIFFFALLFFIVGILGNFYYSSVNALVTILFKRKTESLFKLESMYQLGAAFGPIVGGFLTLKYGIEAAFYTWAGLGILGLILSSLLFRKRNTIKQEIKKPNLRQLLSQLGEKKFDFIIFLIVGSFLTGLFESMITLSIPLYASKIGFDISKVGIIIGTGSLISVFGLLFLGKKLEAIKKHYSLMITTILVGASAAFIIFTHNIAAIILLLGAFVIGRAGGLNITRSFISENFGENIRATGMSISDTVQYGAKFVGPLTAGLIIDFINIEASFIFISAMAAVGIILLIAHGREKMDRS